MKNKFIAVSLFLSMSFTLIAGGAPVFAEQIIPESSENSQSTSESTSSIEKEADSEIVPSSEVGQEIAPLLNSTGIWGDVSWSLDSNGVLTFTSSGTFDEATPPWANSYDVKKVVFTDDVVAAQNSSYLFFGCHNLEEIVGLEKLDTSQTIDMKSMFANSGNLKSLDLSGFNTENVLNMNSMFANNYALTSLDISNFDTKKVTNMSTMFYNCVKLENIDVSGFDTRNVTDMYAMFLFCEKVKELDVSDFDTSSVTDMGSMFANCYKITSLDLSKFDISAVNSMSFMFYNVYALRSIQLGQKFTFLSDTELVDYPDVFAKEWVGKQTGTVFADSSKFTSLYIGANADTYVRARVYQINYVLDGASGNALPTIYQEGKGIVSLPSVEKAGYTFEGWYTDSAMTNRITEISSTMLGDITLYAKFIIKSNVPAYYTVQFLSYDLKEITTYTVLEGDAVLLPEAPSVGGHTFASWVIQGTNIKWNSSDKMTAGNLVLVATYDKNASSKSETAKAPKTGDTTQMTSYITMFVVASVALVGLMVVVIAKNKKQDSTNE